MSVIDFDACETARETRKMLQQWVETVTKKHTGRIPPGLDTNATRDFARWLQVNTAAIARLDCAGALYHDINKLVGASQRGGQLVTAINRVERHFAGPCPTVRGYDNTGKPIECGHGLYADVDERTVVCPVCDQKIDVARNLDKAAVDRDLLPEPKLLEVLKNLGEPVSRVKLYQWIREGRIRPRGWMHQARSSNSASAAAIPPSTASPGRASSAPRKSASDRRRAHRPIRALAPAGTRAGTATVAGQVGRPPVPRTLYPRRRPGRQCDNQAISSIGWWDGGGPPGLGNWRQIAHCPIH